MDHTRDGFYRLSVSFTTNTKADVIYVASLYLEAMIHKKYLKT